MGVNLREHDDDVQFAGTWLGCQPLVSYAPLVAVSVQTQRIDTDHIPDAQAA